MKKTLIILILVLAYQFTNAQVKVLGRIEPNGATDKYPTHVDSLGRGGLMTTASWQERNAIPVERRKAGMLVRVKSASVDSTYTLGVGLANVDWTPFTAGGSNAWGDLTGNLSDQADLQAALNAKVNNAVSVTYTELTDLIASNGLKVNQHYIITDFQTIHTIPNTSPAVVNTGTVEPLLVQASTSNSIYLQAYSPSFPTDIIYYRVDNSQGSTKGFITRRIDFVRNNDLPNDFRNLKYRRWKFNPPVWAGGTSYTYGTVVQHNNTIYACLQAHTDIQEPTVNNNAYWGIVIRDNTDYMSYLSTNRIYVNAAGMTITIPVNASDFVDTLMFSNYANVFGITMEKGNSNAFDLVNNVFYTDGQSFSNVRNKFLGTSTNNTFSIRGTHVFYDNNFDKSSNNIFQGKNPSTSTVDYAFIGNNLTLATTNIISCNAFSNNNIPNRLVNSIFSGRTIFGVRVSEFRHAFFAGNVRNMFANMIGNVVLYNERSLNGVNFNTASVGASISTSTPTFAKFTIDADLSTKTFAGNYLTDIATPDAIARAATEDVIYYGLDLNNKANLTGGNTFSGNQNVNGQVSATSIYIDDTDTFARLQSNKLNITDGSSVRSTDIGTGDVKLSYGSNGITLQPSGMPVTNRTQYLQDASGTLALTSDIPKIFTYTTSGNGSNNMYSVPHGLSYTPTMVVVTPNSDDAMGVLENIKFAGARINGANIEIWYSELASVPPTGTNNLTWTIMVK